eukprot:TRINITY_DN13747_c0_g1_i1.p1 TRINITY_DN13747_c0_g1~~TRINITY_DN13747_c0_g1_i1.p1  ORF type:complete len:831 (-),score=169.14 TRINITY_DN13747_c0_g1_i1:60-2366(-)
MYELHIWSQHLEVSDISKANQLIRRYEDELRLINASLKVEDKHILLVVSLPVGRSLIFDSSTFKRDFWTMYQHVMGLYVTFYDDIQACCQRSRSQDEFSKLIAEALSDNNIRFLESRQSRPSTFTCIFEGGDSKVPDHTLRLNIENENNMRVEVWAHKLKVSRSREAERWCQEETNKLPGRDNVWKIGSGDFVTLSVAMVNTDQEGDDDKLKRDVVKFFTATVRTFCSKYDEIKPFSASDEVKKTEISSEKLSEIQQELTDFLLLTENITVSVNKNHATFKVPSFFDNEATVTIMRTTSTLFLFLHYKDSVPAGKKSRMMDFIGKKNSRSIGFLDMDIDSGKLRYCVSIPQIGQLSTKKLVQQTFYSIFRSAIMQCRDSFADIEEILTGVRPDLNPREKRRITPKPAPVPVPDISLPKPASGKPTSPQVVRNVSIPLATGPIKQLPKPGPTGLSDSKTDVSTPKPKVAAVSSASVVRSSSIASNLSHDSTSSSQSVQRIDSKLLKKGGILGRGGMACVYEGKFCGSKVAIKQLYPSPDMTNAEMWEKLQREISIHASLSHPNIVILHGVSYDDAKELSMIIMENCGKGSLANTFLDGTWTDLKEDSFERRTQVAKDICSGMMYLHANSIFHGDLKPANVLITDSLTAKVADFGISKRMSTALMATVSGYSNFYAAPEVFNGGDGEGRVSAKADVYAFAYILYELITLKNPFAALGVNFFYKLYTEKWRPNLNVAGISDTMKSLISQCWDDNPDNRPSFSDISDLLDEM